MLSQALHINVDGINGSAGLCRLVMRDNVLWHVMPSEVQTRHSIQLVPLLHLYTQIYFCTYGYVVK